MGVESTTTNCNAVTGLQPNYKLTPHNEAPPIPWRSLRALRDTFFDIAKGISQSTQSAQRVEWSLIKLRKTNFLRQTVWVVESTGTTIDAHRGLNH